MKSEAASRDVVDMDRWALGRLGVGTVISVPALDEMPLKQAIDTISHIGALDVGGYQQHWVEAREFEMPAAEVRARGFQILKHQRLDEVLDRVYQQFLRSGDRRVINLHTAYGWFGYWFSFIRPANFSQEISRIIIANASRKFDVKQKPLRLLPWVAHPVSSVL